MKIRKLWLAVVLAIALTVLSVSLLGAQQITIQPGDTVLVISPPIVPLEPDTVYACPPDWACEPPAIVEMYVLSVTKDSTEISGNLAVVEGSWSIHLDRSDGTWIGFDRQILPSVDSVIMCSGGVCNRERRLPYELGGGKLDLSAGTHEVSWELFGDEPDIGSEIVTVTVAIQTGFRIPEPVPMEDGLMVQLDLTEFPVGDSIASTTLSRPFMDYNATLDGVPGNRRWYGWYWLPAPPTGTITVTGSDVDWTGSY